MNLFPGTFKHAQLRRIALQKATGYEGNPALKTRSTLISLAQVWQQRDYLIPLLLVPLALVIWSQSLNGIDLQHMNDLGLISVMPAGVFVALGLLTLSFCFSMQRDATATPLILLHIVALILMLHGFASLVEALPRFGPAWRHVGVIDFILRNSKLQPRIDAYFNWPAFFIWGSFLTQAAGLSSATPFLKWSPILLELAYLLPLWIIFETVTPNRRFAWLAMWFFYLANWVGQDYFSPQGFNFFFYLTIIAILLKWFRSGQPLGWPLPRFLNRRVWRPLNNLLTRVMNTAEAGPAESLPAQRVAILAIVMLALVVSVSSHQLTPFALLFATVGLVFTNRVTTRWLPILLMVMIGTWISYVAVSFMTGRIESMLAAAGQVDQMVSANLTSRLNGSPDHVLILRVRMVLTVALWAGALLGGIVRWRKGQFELSMVLLALASFPLIALQSYGGEMLLRVYMFSLPFMAFYLAALFFPQSLAPLSWRMTAMIGAISTLMFTAFFFARYGNERMEYFSPQELAGVQFMYETAREGSLLASSSSHLPYKYRDYEKFKYLLLDQEILQGNVDETLRLLSDPLHKDIYLILTRSQQAHLEMFYGFTAEAWNRFQQDLLASGRVQLIYENPDARIYRVKNIEVSP